VTKRIRSEALTGIGWLAGWSALTAWCVCTWGWSVAMLSAGVLLIGVAGIRPLALVLWHGLNFLPRGDE